MSGLAKPGDPGKWERVRRLRHGALVKLFRHRWGPTLPDDSSGREDLFELLCVVSVALSATEKKMANTIETMAPWMQPEEAQMLVEHVQQLTIYERMPNNRELGKRMRLTSAEREALKLWPIRPVDLTEEQFAEQASKRERARRAAKRRQDGVKTRAEYLAELKAKPKPWEASGLSRWQWYRAHKVRSDSRRGEVETIVIKKRPHPVRSQQGHQRCGEVKMLREASEVGKVERQETRCSPGLRPHPVAPLEDERLAALNNWGKNAVEKNSPVLRNKIERGWDDLSEFEAYLAFPERLPWCPLEALGPFAQAFGADGLPVMAAAA